MKPQPVQLEQLLNLASALRPDLPPDELYELTVNGLLDLSGYQRLLLWLDDADSGSLRPAAWAGLDRAQAAAFCRSSLTPALIARLRTEAQALAEAIWWPSAAPPPSLSAALATLHIPGGHALLLPLVYTELIGAVVLVDATPAPDAEQVAFIQRCVDHVTIALMAARTMTANLQAQEELRQALVQQSVLLNTIADLATPVLPLLPGVLMLPIVGSLDSQRMLQMSDVLLQTISREVAQVVLLDITGIPVIDSQVAATLLQLARSARLLGCRVVMVGISPETAQALVGLGVELNEMSTHATIAEGLRAALAVVGLKLVRRS